ncbi:MAG: thioesterase family protein [Ewingella americana]|jgi:acyl-coenzyme A thioesterase PaaI-like protein|uniref:thioesterase family protein n=1 Tax=Ewingella TaxID=41201 RepID=UPI000C2FE226|nr:thioesterase family protein [Ewingella americana]MCI1680597.1 thioesterase family protein [Ewingella americana]MCI1856474.1 thioesterase family protein [Ewingella americana]MCI1864080.1 thioesterase family protein [Ewingella americana]MCI2144495.1 thioesterase family protein [Ewingella americana]MCI2165848.1 thioesterase family protein [Ewingella americana]
MSASLSHEAARQLIGEIFVYDMPFNRELGLELKHLDGDSAELTFTNQTRLVGNAAQKILHGGVIASVLDVAAGLVCVTSSLIRRDKPDHPLLEDEMRQRLSKMGTIDLRVDYLRPGRGEVFTASAKLIRAGNKVSVARVDLHSDSGVHIATANATYLVG